MNDIYSKAVMTVIALALSVIAWNKTFTGSAKAFGGDCGSYDTPCYISWSEGPRAKAMGDDGMPVRITNLPR